MHPLFHGVLYVVFTVILRSFVSYLRSDREVELVLFDDDRAAQQFYYGGMVSVFKNLTFGDVRNPNFADRAYPFNAPFRNCFSKGR